MLPYYGLWTIVILQAISTSFAWFPLCNFCFFSSTLSNITLRVHRWHGEHVQGGTLQWAQQAAGHRAQYRGAEDDRQGSVGQQDWVCSVSGRRNYWPGECLAFPLPLLQEWRRWVLMLLISGLLSFFFTQKLLFLNLAIHTWPQDCAEKQELVSNMFWSLGLCNQ